MNVGLKPIELQIAVHRTVDSGKMQDERNQRAMITQHQGQDEERQKSEIRKQRIQQKDAELKGETIKKDQRSGQQHQSHQKKAAMEEEQTKAEHPYKGKHVDFSL